MLGVINLDFRGLDCVETSSNPKSKLKLCKDFMIEMDQTLALKRFTDQALSFQV